MINEAIYNCNGFDWDDGNSEKNWFLHQLTDGKSEQVFFNIPLIVAPGIKHSQREQRVFVLGRTDADRWLFIAAVVRNNRIRVISAREMNDRETRKYAEKIKKYTEF